MRSYLYHDRCQDKTPITAAAARRRSNLLLYGDLEQSYLPIFFCVKALNWHCWRCSCDSSQRKFQPSVRMLQLFSFLLDSAWENNLLDQLPLEQCTVLSRRTKISAGRLYVECSFQADMWIVPTKIIHIQ